MVGLTAEPVTHDSTLDSCKQCEPNEVVQYSVKSSLSEAVATDLWPNEIRCTLREKPKQRMFAFLPQKSLEDPWRLTLQTPYDPAVFDPALKYYTYSVSR